MGYPSWEKDVDAWIGRITAAKVEHAEKERAEAVEIERVLVDALDETDLSVACEPYSCNGGEDRPGYDLAPELLDKLAARGYRLVKVDPFEPVQVGPASFVQTSTTNPADLIKSIWMDPEYVPLGTPGPHARLTEIERWLDRHHEGWRFE